MRNSIDLGDSKHGRGPLRDRGDSEGLGRLQKPWEAREIEMKERRVEETMGDWGDYRDHGDQGYAEEEER